MTVATTPQQAVSTVATTNHSLNSSGTLLYQPQQFQSIKSSVAGYSWFNNQPDPQKCVSEYNKIMRLVKAVRLRMHQAAIQGIDPATGALDEFAYSVVGKANYNLPGQFRITINLNP